MVTEEVFGFESNGGFDVALELDGGKSKHGRHFLDVESVLLGKCEEIYAIFIKYAVAFAMEWCGCNRSAHTSVIVSSTAYGRDCDLARNFFDIVLFSREQFILCDTNVFYVDRVRLRDENTGKIDESPI